jgi:hypothetical protein
MSTKTETTYSIQALLHANHDFRAVQEKPSGKNKMVMNKKA